MKKALFYAWCIGMCTITMLHTKKESTCCDDSCAKEVSNTTKKGRKQKPSHIIPLDPITLGDQGIPACMVAQAQVPVVIKVGASWCKPCQNSIEPFEDLAQEYKPMVDAVFLSLTVDSKPALKNDAIKLLMKIFDIQFKSIPSFVILYKKEVHVISGSDNIHEIKSLIKKLENKHPRLTAITPDNIDKLIYQSKKPVILKIHAAWCPPCSYMESIMDNVAHDYKSKAHFYRLDIMDHQAFAEKLMQKYDIQGIPLFFFFKDGKVVKKFTGARTEDEFKQEVQNFLKEA